MKLWRPRKKQKAIVLKDGNGGQACSIIHNPDTDEIDVVLNKPINLSIRGDLGVAIDGDFDITAFGDIRIDTFLRKLFMNSYVSKYIKDRPESIEKRKEIELKQKSYDEWMEVNRDKMIEFAQQFLIVKKDE